MSMKKVFRTTFLHTLAVLPLAAFCLHGQAIAEPKNTASKYEGQSLCDAGDDIDRSCFTHAGKILSICGTTKQTLNIMYMVYGTPEHISISSPRTGEFPLRIASSDLERVFYFTENGKKHFAYIVYDDADDGMPLTGDGLITQDTSNHNIDDYDFCTMESIFTKNQTTLNKYKNREQKDKFHISDLNDVVTQEVKYMFYAHMHPR